MVLRYLTGLLCLQLIYNLLNGFQFLRLKIPRQQPEFVCTGIFFNATPTHKFRFANRCKAIVFFHDAGDLRSGIRTKFSLVKIFCMLVNV